MQRHIHQFQTGSKRIHCSERQDFDSFLQRGIPTTKVRPVESHFGENNTKQRRNTKKQIDVRYNVSGLSTAKRHYCQHYEHIFESKWVINSQ